MKNTFKMPGNKPTAPAYRARRKVKIFAMGSAFNFSLLLENLPFITYLSFLGIVYIANAHYAVKVIREIKVLQEEMKKSSWESNAQKSELMFNSMESEVSKRVQHIGLDELKEKPSKLKM